ncbi:MAG: polysaccharide deacetylase family protein [Bacteroidetes bacterium]|nr:polysaccharide deacetylase family protein [Bacteroidota bacterium]
MFTFRSATISFFIILFLLNMVSIFIYPVNFVFYLLLILVYLTISVVFSFFIRSGFHMKVLCNAETTEKKIAITFDDGPHPEITPLILDILHNKAQVAFFIIGRKIKNNEEIIKRMDAEGHLIGNHSYTHSNWFDFFSPRKMKYELAKSDQDIMKITGKRPLLFRPPYGVINPMVKKAIRSSDYRIIGFSNRAWDTSSKNEEKILNRLIRKLRPGDILLLHDSCAQSAGVLIKLLQHLDNNGFSVVRPDELLNIQPYA